MIKYAGLNKKNFTFGIIEYSKMMLLLLNESFIL